MGPTTMEQTCPPTMLLIQQVKHRGVRVENIQRAFDTFFAYIETILL